MATVPKDDTFRNYSGEQAAAYAKVRSMAYPVALINAILEHHRATGGDTGVLVDVGCGPGNATRDLAPFFNVVYGADPGEAMIKTATELGGTTATGAPIKFTLCSAEELDHLPEVEHGSVDMISAAVCAHWFDMPKFWAAAARLLKPAGTVAIWAYYRNQNLSLPPTATKVRDILERFRKETLAPYTTPGNRLAESGYDGLVMPWDVPDVSDLFDKSAFVRREFELKKEEIKVKVEDPLAAMEALMGTSSPVARWREAHPDLVGTEKDCVKEVMVEIRALLTDEGAARDLAPLLSGMSAVLLLVKRV